MSKPVALVTGASKGLGREIARLFARRGYRLVLVARGADVLSQVEGELRGMTEVAAVAEDVSEDAERIVRTALERFGRVDVLINNASEIGPTPMPRLEDLHWEDFLRLFRVNVAAALHLTQLVLPGMKERRSGVIINVTSDAGVEAYPTWGGYGATKAALEHVSRVLAAELDGSGVRVYVVDPGEMNTEMHQRAAGVPDLPDKPLPVLSAPIFLHLVEQERRPFGRFQAQSVIAEAV